jgi:molybdate transport system ATP-binding protein
MALPNHKEKALQATHPSPVSSGEMRSLWQVDVSERPQRDGHFELRVRFQSRASRLALIGPSGSGKTLTLRMIAGVLSPERGRIEVGGRVLLDTRSGIDLAAQQRAMATVFQDYALFPHLTVHQNILFAVARGWRNPAPHDRNEEAERWIERFSLQGVVNLYPHQISGGQRQRTALARALVGRPRALLLDEPFAALDRELRQRLREELLALQAATGLPMLIITHDAEDLEHLAQDVIRLKAGSVEAIRAEL